MRRKLISGACLAVAGLAVALGQQPSDVLFHAIRSDDLDAVREVVKASKDARDEHATTALMYAAAYGSIGSMKLLLDAGADPNAKNAFDATALMWCAADPAKVRLLAGHGANVNAQSKKGMTPLLIGADINGNIEVVKFLLSKGAEIAPKGTPETALLEAADANDVEMVRLFLEKGSDVNAKDPIGDTALMSAASFGNVEMIQLLLAKGADVNVVDTDVALTLKNGPVGLGRFTPLLNAAVYASPQAIQLLLDAGARVNVQDIRGMTPLMRAIASDRPNPAVVKLLLARGADPKIKCVTGEDAYGWARKYSNPPVMEALGIHKQAASLPVAVAVDETKLPTSRQAAQKGLNLLQRTAADFFTTGGCVSCHAQNLTGMTISVARSNGFNIDEKAAAMEMKAVQLQWKASEQMLLQRVDPPGRGDTIMYSLLQLAAEGVAPNPSIDALVHNLAAEQHADGAWRQGQLARPPLEDGSFGRTAIGIRALAVFTPPGRKAEFDHRVQRAAAWLKAATPRSTDDRVMQLLGLKWAGADEASLAKPLHELIALERAGGGWSQTPYLESDAYATGTVLYTMHELGMSANDPAYRRGVKYLLSTQAPDGSWHVTSRVVKFQPYFQSGFPYDHDQWISAAATAWSTMALIYASADTPARASAR